MDNLDLQRSTIVLQVTVGVIRAGGGYYCSAYYPFLPSHDIHFEPAGVGVRVDQNTQMQHEICREDDPDMWDWGQGVRLCYR